MKDGVLLVAFGKKYEAMALHCVNTIRQYSKIPVRIVTNLRKQERLVDWKRVNNISIRCVKIQDNSSYENRAVKTRIDQYSPFTRTLYLDCDTTIENAAFLSFFRKLNHADICMVRMPKSLSLIGSLPYYMGGVFLFKKNVQTRIFFRYWYKYWKKRRRRDMIALAITLDRSKSQIVVATIDEKQAGFPYSNIIAHRYGTWKNKYYRKKFRRRPDLCRLFQKKITNSKESAVA